MSIQQTAVDLSSLSTVPTSNPGQVYVDQQGKTWQYVRFASNTATGIGVKISTDGNFTASLGASASFATTEPAQAGFYQGSVTATANQYGWVFRGGGAFVGVAAAAIAANVKIYFTSNGNVDDTAAGSPLAGVTCTSAVGGAGPVNLYAMGLITGAAF
jgi:hypothetical protein